MEGTMEYSNKENITGAVASAHESSENLSVPRENIDKEIICEPEHTHSGSSNDIMSDINSFKEQNTNVTVHNYTETNSDNVGDTCREIVPTTQTGSEFFGLNKNNGRKTEQLEVVSEVNQVTERYREYVSISHPERKINQSSEYVGEYVLGHTENVYISEVQGSSSVYTSVAVSDDINNIPDQVNQQNTTTSAVETITNENEMGEGNWLSEYPADQKDTKNVSQGEQGHENDELDKHCIKNEFAYSNTESNINNTVEIGNQNIDGNIRNEGSVEEGGLNNMSVEGNAIENVLGESTNVDSENRCSYDVKQETSSMEVCESDSLTNKEQESHNMNESVIHEQIISTKDGTAENADLTNESVVSSENMAVEDYTIAEEMEMTEIQEGEYTIVEGPSSLDISTNQQDESGNSDGTLVVFENYESSEDTIIDEQNEMYLSELRSEAESRQSVSSSVSSQSCENKPRRGRKSTHEIPMHVLGHNISKPVESVPNGRALPKPRLGVKVPYRNLTSQIVSKAEIEKEVMDRARLKQEQANSRADILFARKLTQRLARKIAPSPGPPRKVTESKKSKDSDSQLQRKDTDAASDEITETDSNQNQDSSKIHNDSDLLAILEGEGDEMPVLPKEVPETHVDDTNLKLLEREIALQQLQDLPNQSPKLGIYRRRRAPVLTPEASVSKKSTADNFNAELRETSTSGHNSITKPKDDLPVHLLSDKENETTRQPISKGGLSTSPKSDHSNVETLGSPKKQPVEIEPQVKVNMVLKTYSRKRKTTEFPEALIESSLPKKTMLAEIELKVQKTDATVPTTNVYVTKSSRVIKKKVIWDPDETPTRSPKSITRSDLQSPKIAPVKITKPVEKLPNTEKVPEKKSSSGMIQKEKIMDKKNNEKSSNKKSVVSQSEKKVIISKSDGSKNKIPLKNKKIRSEVDKLLMDEGAVKMLYDLKNNDEAAPKKKKDVYSVEKAHKEIIKKANEIKTDLQQNTSNESPKSLRKKEAMTPSPVKPAQITSNTERKMSKDSTRSSLHTPPGSPAYSQSSMLVRRRSSSSISSSDELDENDTSKIQRKKSLTISSDIPKPKKIKKNEPNEQTDKSTEDKGLSVKVTPISVEDKLSPYKSFTVKKTNKHVTINLNYINEQCYCTVQVLEELTATIKKFAKEKDCHVVCITSSCKAFCLGLDYTSLISDAEDVRKEKATELAERVRDFLLCLLKFPKVLVAGIQGECIGLGVTMLPLFDMVIASDTATFSTPYASLGCVAEAGFLLSPPIFTNHGLAAELLFTTQKLTADDAFRRGLVSRLCWPEKYNETLKNIMISISTSSKQSLEATKKQLRRHLVQTTEAAINSESKILVEHWTSSECQKSFAQIIEKGN